MPSIGPSGGLDLLMLSGRPDDKDGKSISYMGIKSFLAGGFSGASQLFVTYPMEYVKTQIQLDEKGRHHGRSQIMLVGPGYALGSTMVEIQDRITRNSYSNDDITLGKNSFYNGTLDCIRKTYDKNGVIGFYRGMGVTLLGYIYKVALRFYVLEHVQNILKDPSGGISGNRIMLSGMAAGVAEALIAVTPFETLKTKFINDERSPQPQFRGLVHGVKTIYKNEGFRGIYQGGTPTVLKEASNQAIRVYVVQSLKDWYVDGDRRKRVPLGWVAIFGAIGGALSVCGNTPIDVVKTRMQGLEAQRYKNTWDCASKIWNHEGALAFYKGVFPRLIRVSADVAITFMVYDGIMEWLSKLF